MISSRRVPGWSWFLLLACLISSRVRAAENPPTEPEPPPSVDHAGLIRGWNEEARARGEQLYGTLCITCHGTPTQAGSLPTSRAFWKEPFKNGSDPYGIFRTLDQGLGQMPAWTFLNPQQRYDVIHYVRETFLKPLNPSMYYTLNEAYLDGLPRATGTPFVKTAAMLEFEKGPKYLRMDFGPVLFWTLQVAEGNIAYKGLAIRLDSGPGGLSKGKAWVVYDHDTLRVAAAWTGNEFVDWKGIAFDGSHQTHTSIAGERIFVNPPGPGCADPDNGSWTDPRFRGRDGLPYGPLPRTWAHFQGVYLQDQQAVVAYTIGDTQIHERPGWLEQDGFSALTRTLEVGPSSRELLLRLAPTNTATTVSGISTRALEVLDGGYVLRVPASPQSRTLQVVVARPPAETTPDRLAKLFASLARPAVLGDFRKGGAPRWNPPIATQGKLGTHDGPFAVDELTPPDSGTMPWHSWMRFGGFDFFRDGQRAAIATWNGDVWLVSGIDRDLQTLVWKRIATGLFQPLGVKIVNEVIHVTCRDMIARLHDLNGDDEIDFIENFNNDHQVTEHFHEFAMGLQTDAEGNFYYAKSARHALPALVAHHGTLLRVAADGSRTDILATGFRAANGICVNGDGTFFVTDQEGHWTPKNRINWVRPGGFYGNMFGYHDRPSSADADMEQPLVWITNEMDRSPGELVRVPAGVWGPLQGSLLNLSYGTGRIFLVPNETVGGQLQGGVVQLPLPDSPTGVMRGRFHPRNGHLYTCGLYAWAGNRLGDGGFYRIRSTAKPLHLPVQLHARRGALELIFTEALQAAAVTNSSNYALKVWGLKRTANYGSPHVDEHPLRVTSASLAADGRTVRLAVPELSPTWGMEIAYRLVDALGTAFSGRVHNTIHALGND